jgi:hypothetical protein
VAAEQLNPDIILLDISMPLLNGVDAARRLCDAVPSAKVIFVTTHADATYVTRAFGPGASGYVLKRCAAMELLNAVHEVLKRRTYVTPLIRKIFRDVIGVSVVDKAVLSKRTGEYRGWVEAFARNHKIPMEWAQKGVRKEDYVRPWLRRMERAGRYGVYFIFQSMEQGPSFRCSMPKFPTRDPNHRILRAQRSRFTHYYFYLRDETLGPMAIRVASFFPFQATYYLNGHSFIEQELNRNKIDFRKNDNAFLAVEKVSALQATADRLTGEVIGERLDYWTLLPLCLPADRKGDQGRPHLCAFPPEVMRSPPSATSSNYLRLLDLRFVGVFLFTI